MLKQSLLENSYQIKHAIGRNYLRKAFYQNSAQNAKLLFLEGEKIIIDIIKNAEVNQGKAYSVHCYIFEKIRYLLKFNIEVTNEELRNMQFYIKNFLSYGDEMIKESERMFYSYCSKINKLGSLSLTQAELSKAINSSKNFDLNIILDDDID